MNLKYANAYELAYCAATVTKTWLLMWQFADRALMQEGCVQGQLRCYCHCIK